MAYPKLRDFTDMAKPSDRNVYQRIAQLPIPSPNRKNKDAIFNASYLEDIPDALREWNSRRTFLVVSKALDTNTDRVMKLEAVLGEKVVGKKVGVRSHSPYADVIDITHHLHQTNADSLVCIGSSSYSDACKIAVLLHTTLPPTFTADDMEALVDRTKGITTSASSALNPPTVKLILVPTSLSASEWNPVSSATNPGGKKQHFGSLDGPGAAELIVLDPGVASTAPERLWLSSGIRAVDHCVETLCAARCADFPEAGERMEQGLRSLLKGLLEYRIATEKRRLRRASEVDVAAVYGVPSVDSALLGRGISDCQWGARDAMMGFLIWHIPMGASHAIGHQVGSVAGVMHGVTSCVCLAPVLRFTKDRNPAAQEKVVKIFNEVLGYQETEAGDCMEAFVKRMGFPTRLSEVGVKDDRQVEEIAEKTMTDVWGGGKRQLEFDEIMQILNSVR